MTLRKFTWPVIATAALFVGVGIGTGYGPPPVVQTVPGPTRTVTQTQTVTDTPQVCADALAAGDETLSLASQGFMIVSDVLTAASQFDLEGMDAGNARLAAMEGDVKQARANYDALSAECRAQQ